MQRMNYVLAIATLAAATTIGAAGCSSSREVDVKESVERAIEREQIDGVKADWDEDSKVLHLKGTVATDTERARAETVATRAVGTSGKVANELTLAGAEDRAKERDGEIEERLENLLKEDQALAGRDIEVEVNAGVVTLTGEVASEQDKRRAVNMAYGIPGVTNIVDALEVKAANENPRRTRNNPRSNNQ